MLCSRGSDRHGRPNGVSDVGNSEKSEGDGSDAEDHWYPAEHTECVSEGAG